MSGDVFPTINEDDNQEETVILQKSPLTIYYDDYSCTNY